MKLRAADPYGNLYGRSYQRYYESDPGNLTMVDMDRPLLTMRSGVGLRFYVEEDLQDAERYHRQVQGTQIKTK